MKLHYLLFLGIVLLVACGKEDDPIPTFQVVGLERTQPLEDGFLFIGAGVVVDDIFVVGARSAAFDAHLLCAFEVETGAIRWQTEVSEALIGFIPDLSSPHVMDDGNILLVSKFGRVITVDSDSGDLLRTYDFPTIQGFLPDDERTVFGNTALMTSGSSSGAYLFAYDGSTGWWDVVHRNDAPSGKSRRVQSAAGAVMPDGSSMYYYIDDVFEAQNAKNASYTLYGINADKSIAWSYELANEENRQFFFRQPTVADGVVYLDAQTDRYAFDALSGEVIWNVQETGNTFGLGSRFWKNDDQLYRTFVNGNMCRLDPLTGEQLWCTELVPLVGFNEDLPLILNDGLLVGVASDFQGSMIALDQETGQQEAIESLNTITAYQPALHEPTGWLVTTSQDQFIRFQLELQ